MPDAPAATPPVAARDDWPSLADPPPPPRGWLQWKGTDACIDIDCTCGARFHFDGYFLYPVRCVDDDDGDDG